MHESNILQLLYEFEHFRILSHNPTGNGVGLWPNEMKCLLWSALNAPQANWVEIGSWNGGSTVLLCLARQFLNYGPKIFTVDINYDGYFDENISNGGFWKFIRKINGSSKTFHECYPQDKISFAFIDGFHSFNWIMRDFNNIKDHLIDKAILVFHDCSPAIYTPNNSLYIKSCQEKVNKNLSRYMNSKTQDFLVDEAIAYILQNKRFKPLEIPVRQYEFYPERTRLNKWIRGTTSPYNAIMAIQYDATSTS